MAEQLAIIEKKNDIQMYGFETAFRSSISNGIVYGSLEIDATKIRKIDFDLYADRASITYLRYYIRTGPSSSTLKQEFTTTLDHKSLIVNPDESGFFLVYGSSTEAYGYISYNNIILTKR